MKKKKNQQHLEKDNNSYIQLTLGRGAGKANIKVSS